MIDDTCGSHRGVKMPTGPGELAEDGTRVAYRWMGGWRGEHRGTRNLWNPLWPTRVRRVATKTRGLRRPMWPIKRELQGPAYIASHLAGDSSGHSRHLSQEAAETRCNTGRRRGGNPVCWRGDVEGRVVLGAASVVVSWLRTSWNALTVGKSVGLPLSFASEVSVVKHFFTVGVKCPVVAFTCKDVTQLWTQGLFHSAEIYT